MARKEEFKAEAFLKYIGKGPINAKTTKEILDEIYEETGRSISWNTLQKYLERLEGKGKVNKVEHKKFHLWHIPK